MIGDAERILALTHIVSAVQPLRGLRPAAHARVLRESIHYIWELRLGTKYGGGRERSTLSHNLPRSEICADHPVPMKYIVQRLMEEPAEPERVERTLREWGDYVVISRAQHRQLETLGLGNEMPSSWDRKNRLARYEFAQIEIFNPCSTTSL